MCERVNMEGVWFCFICRSFTKLLLLTTMRAKWAKKRMRRRQRKKRKMKKWNYRLDRGVVGLFSSQSALTLCDDPDKLAQASCINQLSSLRRTGVKGFGWILFLMLKYHFPVLSSSIISSHYLNLPHFFIISASFDGCSRELCIYFILLTFWDCVGVGYLQLWKPAASVTTGYWRLR